jgi:elongation factor 1 alpha-like protein
MRASKSHTTSDSVVSLTFYPDADDQKKLAQCLEDILDIVGESMPEHVVKEAIVRCDFNKEVALNTLLNNPVTGHGMSGGLKAQRRRRVSPRPSVGSEEVAPENASPTTSDPVPIRTGGKISALSAGPSIPTVIATSGGGEEQPKKQQKVAPPPVVATAAAVTRLQPTSTGGDQNDQRSRSQSPSVQHQHQGGATARGTPVITKSGSVRVNVQMRKGKLDPLEEYKKERGGEKDLLNLVVVGHVDSGKSTLMGHLLFSLGTVGSKVSKYKRAFYFI